MWPVSDQPRCDEACFVWRPKPLPVPGEEPRMIVTHLVSWVVLRTDPDHQTPDDEDDNFCR